MEAQLRDVERLRAWRRGFIPENEARAAKYQLHGNQYHDQLVRDLGHRALRKARASHSLRACTSRQLTRRSLVPGAYITAQPWWTLGVAELLWPTQASDYRALFAQPAAGR